VKIESLKSNLYPFKQSSSVKDNSKTGEQSHKTSDSLQISSKGQELSKISDSGKNLDSIREKIDQGFYNSEEVLNKVADSILQEINSK
jgi:anti-sigma28 factor (negative regulator of flagellin synthesis)